MVVSVVSKGKISLLKKKYIIVLLSNQKENSKIMFSSFSHEKTSLCLDQHTVKVTLPG